MKVKYWRSDQAASTDLEHQGKGDERRGELDGPLRTRGRHSWGDGRGKKRGSWRDGADGPNVLLEEGGC